MRLVSVSLTRGTIGELRVTVPIKTHHLKVPTPFPNFASPPQNQPHQTTKMSSSTTRPPASSSTTAQPTEKSFFEQQREVLLKEIGVVSFYLLGEGGGDALTRLIQ